jgi:hypothetical protein
VSRVDDNTVLNSTDTSRFTAAKNATIWDPRADLDDDGDVDAADQTLYNSTYSTWTQTPKPTVSQAFSDVGNPYMFQSVPHFALDTAASATSGKLMLNHHRARFEDVAMGRWLSRDPLYYPLRLASSSMAGGRPTPGWSWFDRITLKEWAPTRGNEPLSSLYGFVENNSVSNADPSGLGPVKDCKTQPCDCTDHCLYEADQAGPGGPGGGSCFKGCKTGTGKIACWLFVDTVLKLCQTDCLAQGDDSSAWAKHAGAIAAYVKCCK